MNQKDLQKNEGILKLLEGLVVQVQTWVAREVQLLKLWRQILRQSDLTQLVAAQIHTLATKNKKSQIYTESCTA